MSDVYDELLDEFAAPTPKRKPLDYRALYTEVGTKYGVDPDLLYRQAAQESVNFADRFVYGPGKSPAGAAGIAQFMSDTARQYGLHVGKGRDDRYNPRLAADAQARMMRDLLDKHGDARLALAAYNSGHNKSAQQARRAAQQIPETRGYVQKVAPKGDPYDQLLDEAGGTASTVARDDYDVLLDQFVTEPPAQQKPLARDRLAKATGGAGPVARRRRLSERVTAGVGALPAPAPAGPPIGELRQSEDRLRAPGTTIGELRRADEAEVTRQQRIRMQVRSEQVAGAQALRESPFSAQARLYQPHLNEDTEVVRRLGVERAGEEGARESDARFRELVSSFTDEDRAQLAAAVQRMRGQDPVSRGIETGAQRVGSGLLYKLAGMLDIAGKNPAAALFYIPVDTRKQMANYLRRQAARGEVSIAEIEAEAPPGTAQSLADFITHSVGALPEVYGATIAAGPIGGFAALGGTEALGRQESAANIVRETAKGAIIGGVFSAAPALEEGRRTLLGRAADTARSGAAIGAGTYATEKGFGATDHDALRSAATNMLFHGAARVPEVVSRFTAAAERALKTPDVAETGRATVPEETQTRLRATEVTREPVTQPTEVAAVETAPAPSRVEAPAEITPEQRRAEYAAVDAEIAERRAATREPGDIWSPEKRAEMLANLSDVPVVPKRSFAEQMAERAAEPIVTEPVTEVPRRSIDEMMAERTESSKAAPESLLVGIRNKTGTGPHEMIEQILASPHKSKILRDIGEGARPLQSTSTSYMEFERPSGEVVKIAIPEGRTATYGDRFSGFDVSVSPVAPHHATLQPRRTRNVATGKRGQFKKGKPTPAELAAEVGTKVEVGGETGTITGHASKGATVLVQFEEGKPSYPHPRQAVRELDTGKPLRRTGEEGYVNISEIQKGIKKLADEVGENFAGEKERNLTYLLNTKRGRVVVQVAIGEGGRAYPFVYPADAKGNPLPTSLERGHNLGLDTILALKRYLLKEHPEIKSIEFSRVGTTGGEVGRKRLLQVKPRTKPSRGQGGFADIGEISRGVTQAAEKFDRLTQDKIMLREAARAYQRDYSALERHQARREGLAIANDDVAANYFNQLRRFASQHKPDMAAEVDRAEALYARGKYGDATTITEKVLSGTHEYVGRLSGAHAAIGLVEKGREPKSTEWAKVIAEVRRRLKETGGPLTGGSVVYDVNKYPKGGLPDHAKIAYIVEPVIEAIRADAARLLAAGKLKAEQYTDHIRSEVDKLMAGPDFTDWHKLNRLAARSAIVDQLRKEGPPPTESVEAAPVGKPRSLPKTLEKSGREPGTDLTYEELPNKTTIAHVERRLRSEGPEALEDWYLQASPSAERSEAFRQLADHYQIEAAKTTDPARAAKLRTHAVELANIEVARATSMGQAVQQYSQLLKYTPAGITKEIVKLQKRGVEVPATKVAELVTVAAEHQRADAEVTKARARVAELQPAGQGAGLGAGPGKGPGAGRGAGTGEGEAAPRTRAPKKPRGESLLPSAFEKAEEQLAAATKRRRRAKVKIAEELAKLEQNRTLAGYYRRSLNITRSLMVSAVSTAMRNLQTQVIRYDIERLTDLVEHTMRRSVGLDSDLNYRDIGRNTLRVFKRRQEAEAREILGEHPVELARMFNLYAGGVEVPLPNKAARGVERMFGTVEKGAELANFANRMQEFHVRSAEFLAELDLHIKKEKGMSLEQFVKRNGMDQIPQELVGKAVDKALEVTFSANPGRDGAGGRLLNTMIEVGNFIPPTASPVAFPRFMFNNLKFLYQYNPTGLIDLARKGQNRPRVISRALVGTSMLLLGYQFRNSDHAGEKWYELRIGGTTFDTRPFGPFSTYLFLGEMLRRARYGEGLPTKREFLEAFGVSTGPGGTGIALAEKLYDNLSAWFKGDDSAWSKVVRTIKTEGGEWGRALLTPIRQVRDLIAAFDPEEGITHETSSMPAVGPVLESIPFASRAAGLPPAYRTTTATPIHQERPAVKALSGWRVVQEKTFLEQQLDELHFQPSEIRSATGHPRVDSIEKRLMGPLMDQLSTELSTDEEFKKASKAERAIILRDLLEDVRESVREMGEEEDPAAYEELREMRKPKREKTLEKEEQNSPGISRALQLGVPLAIPRRRAGEDDLAYRARLKRTAREQQGKLDAATAVDNFFALDAAVQRKMLRSALYT